MFSGIVPRGCRAPGLTTEAVINHRRSLLWEMWGRNKYAPTAVPAPDDTIEDFDLIIEAIFETDEDNDFEDFIEYFDNQRW